MRRWDNNNNSQRNELVGLCQCREDERKTLDKGYWKAVMSPYEEKYVDVKYTSDLLGSSGITVKEVSQQWRLWFLAVRFNLLLLAPSISNWVHFYYSTSMVIGVFMFVVFILFQGMKLVPFGRKKFFYLATIYGSVLGARSYLFHHFTVLVNSVLVNFGIHEEMQSDLQTFNCGNYSCGCWTRLLDWEEDIHRKGWNSRCCCCPICYVGNPLFWNHVHLSGINPMLHKGREVMGRHSHPEFLSRSSPQKDRHSPRGASAWPDSPVKGVASPSFKESGRQEYYSTFHKLRNRKKFTKKEWDDFTLESTRHALAEWAASPEFTDWVIEHADRIKLLPSDSSDETMESESELTDENVVGSQDRCGFLKW